LVSICGGHARAFAVVVDEVDELECDHGCDYRGNAKAGETDL
jgi:hypothetical protein